MNGICNSKDLISKGQLYALNCQNISSYSYVYLLDYLTYHINTSQLFAFPLWYNNFLFSGIPGAVQMMVCSCSIAWMF